MNLLLALPLLLGVFVLNQQMTSMAAAKPFPIVTANAYTARVMIVLQDQGKIEYAIEKSDLTQNKASMEVVIHGSTTMTMMDYDEGNIYFVRYGWHDNTPTQCEIYDMQKAHEDPFLGMQTNFKFFGGWNRDQDFGQPHVYKATNIFKLGGQNAIVYQGTKTVDGIVADWWSTTMQWSSKSDSLTVNYYFTPDGWKYDGYVTKGSVFPLRIEVTGQIGKIVAQKIHHFYEYVNFETSDTLPMEAFSIPKGMGCIPRGAKTKPVLAIPDTITYNRESVDANGNVKSERVVHDKKNGYMKIFSSSEILYDFNDGVRYSLNNNGQCTRRAIDPNLDPEAVPDGNYVKDNGPSEFSQLGKSSVYTGPTLTRFTNSDSWGGKTKNNKPYDVNFAKTNWNYQYSNVNFTSRPLSMTKDNIRYNFFDVVPGTHYVLSLDYILESCRLTTGMRMFVLSFYCDRSYVPEGTFYNKPDREMILSAIAKAAGVNYLQVNSRRFKWDKNTQHLQVIMRLIGPTQPQYLYRRTDNSATKGTFSSQTVQLSKSSYDQAVRKSAQLCENNASSGKFLCRNFDLCNNTDGSFSVKMYLTLPTSSKVSSSSSCDHFARSIDGNPDIPLTKAATNLKNAVKKGKLKVTVRYESRYGYKHTAKLTAFKIQNNIFRRRSPASRRAIRKFWYYGSDYSIIKTETLTSIRTSQDCASECLGRTEYECKTYSFCRGTNQCTLSKSPPQKTGQRSNCPIRVRLYTADFMWMRGKTAVTKDQVTFRNVGSINQCAEKCLKYTKYKCESLDYCYKTRACVLHNTHIYALAQNQIQNITTRGCYHLSKRYLLDFQVTSNTALRSDDPKNFEVVSVSTPDQCAYLCRTSYSGQGGCVQFDFCSSNKQCHIVSAKTQKYVSSKAQSDCDTFTLAVTANVQAQSSSSSSSGYSNGSFAGLAIGMIIIGVAFGGLIMYILHKKRILHKIVAH